jgi:hypothetical protein
MAPGRITDEPIDRAVNLGTANIPEQGQPNLENKSKSLAAAQQPTSASGTVLVLDPTLITTDYRPLQFSAAASLQIPAPTGFLTPSSSHLVSAPYNSPDHHLDLRTLSPAESLLARALTVLRPIRTDYAIADYLQSFNWDDVLATLRHLAAREGHEWTSSGWYTVIFRSRLKPNCDRLRLHELDERSHAEAATSGGLLKYWFGTTDSDCRNLATCKLFLRIHSTFVELAWRPDAGKLTYA